MGGKASGIVAVLAGVVLLASCSTSVRTFRRGRDLALEGHWDRAVESFERAIEEDPGNLEYRIALQNALLEAHYLHLQLAHEYLSAQELAKAEGELELALRYEPSNVYAEEELRKVRRRIRAPEVGSGAAPAEATPAGKSTAPLLTLKFAEGTSLKKILKVLTDLEGVNILFDESFRDKPVTVDLEGVTFRQALDLLTSTNGLFYKEVDPSTVTILPQGHREP